MDKAIEIVEQRLGQARKSAKRWFDNDTRDMYEFYMARALELEFTLNHLRAANEDA